MSTSPVVMLRLPSGIAVGVLLLVSGARGSAEPPEYGPLRGNLVIAGGGSLAGTLILENFILLAGGSHRRFIVVPTAQGNRNEDGTVRGYDEQQVVAPWHRLGAKNVRMLHTHDPKVADTAIVVTGNRFKVMGKGRSPSTTTHASTGSGNGRTSCCLRATSTT